MELHQLRYALAVADHGTFTAAAKACFVAQPSLSQAVRTLERQLGRQDVVAVLPPGTRRPRAGLPTAQLADMPLVALPVGTSSRRLLDEALAAAGVRADIAVETDQREALVPLVLAGAGASVLPR